MRDGGTDDAAADGAPMDAALEAGADALGDATIPLDGFGGDRAPSDAGDGGG
jgi:hypothetical protein